MFCKHFRVGFSDLPTIAEQGLLAPLHRRLVSSCPTCLCPSDAERQPETAIYGDPFSRLALVVSGNLSFGQSSVRNNFLRLNCLFEQCGTCYTAFVLKSLASWYLSVEVGCVINPHEMAWAAESNKPDWLATFLMYWASLAGPCNSTERRSLEAWACFSLDLSHVLFLF